MSHFPPLNEQMDLIRRGTEEIIPEEELVAKLIRSENTNTPLRVKLGCDPSRPDLHIGHAVVLRKLRHFQDLGHQAILLIGDVTAMIGDPTGRNKTRPQLTWDETRENGESYIKQASIILDLEKLQIVYNSQWLNSLSFQDVIKLTSFYTVAQMLERDDFTKRHQDGVPISIHEFLYPLAQGYDSVALASDVELGGTDQKFNLLVGRNLQREYGQNPQIIITTPLLEGTDGKEKMSKSYGNYIGITDTADDMYGKTLSIPDELIARYLEFTTDVDTEFLNCIRKDLEEGKSTPRDLKRSLAREIVSLYHGQDAAQNAEALFDQIHIEKEIPDDIPEYRLSSGDKLISIMVDTHLSSSNSDARRLINSGSVSIDGIKVTDIHERLYPGKEYILKVGKRKFLKVSCQ